MEAVSAAVDRSQWSKILRDVAKQKRNRTPQILIPNPIPTSDANTHHNLYYKLMYGVGVRRGDIQTSSNRLRRISHCQSKSLVSRYRS